ELSAVIELISCCTPPGRTMNRLTVPLGVKLLPDTVNVVINCCPDGGLTEIVGGGLHEALAVTVCVTLLLCRLVGASTAQSVVVPTRSVQTGENDQFT